MKSVSVLFIGWLLLTGCQQVVSEQPVGLTVHQADATNWDGTWLSDGEVLDIKMVDASQGRLQLAWVEDAEGQLVFKSMHAVLKKGNRALYISAADIPDEDFGGAYLWARIENDGQKLVLWAPDFQAFEQAHKKQQLQAKLSRDEQGKTTQILLQHDMEGLIQMIESDDSFIDWHRPMVLMRLLD